MLRLGSAPENNKPNTRNHDWNSKSKRPDRSGAGELLGLETIGAIGTSGSLELASFA